jgi:uncharacterized membrane protein YcaP (DUF421 family)
MIDKIQLFQKVAGKLGTDKNSIEEFKMYLEAGEENSPMKLFDDFHLAYGELEKLVRNLRYQSKDLSEAGYKKLDEFMTNNLDVEHDKLLSYFEKQSK